LCVLPFWTQFFPAQVYLTLKRLKPSTSVGPDGIPNVLKNCATAVSLPISHIFDTCFKDSILPCSWKTANVLCSLSSRKAVLAIPQIIDPSHSHPHVVEPWTE